MHGRITEEGLAELRRVIGVERPTYSQFNECASKDAIRHFAYGIGDTNPLWSDEEYAKKTRWGGIIAPPCFLFSMWGRGARRGLPGVHGMWSGVELDFFLPIRLDDRITSTVALNRVEEKASKFAKRTVLQEQLYRFRNQSGELVAEVRDWNIRSERDTAKSAGKYRKLTLHHYTQEELRAIEADYEREEVRGANPRCWEDVQEGDHLTPIVKGPLTITDNIAWKIGWGFRPFVFAHRMTLEYRRRHPGAMIDNELGIPDVPERVHWDNEFAREVGVPAAYDYGPQRASWLGQLMTNWIGDDGFLRRFRVEARHHNLIGDTTWCKGKVTNKRIENGDHFVECEIWCENQDGIITAPGKATVVLPSR